METLHKEDLQTQALESAKLLTEHALSQPTVGKARKFMRDHEPDWDSSITGTIDGAIQALELAIWSQARQDLNRELDKVKLGGKDDASF
ncbi:MAG: hypothetical protein ACTIBQ_01475 [Lactobacillus delbrueckii]|jgi:hypothetical protein|uniref:hypothetical protein n=1 Tax=Lactobacillus delbrueckii TaxID=1584 RepID=UPI0004A5CA11|nr:hypothetical protein [Lactobacillus delbrueckii]MCD5449089.1 hypothetical protein [Lactobacillus delbrueckii subsp. bulgaricus]MCH5408868.1 hypothetical protein [Lactobacillus delbrueckii]MCT3469483.1 hypothetical protein [Lactobacillus delbrueckii subsp. bulgaricus]MEC3724163.1 hypothetical protein [Lactobacillus delbrueckii subsp. bulgaricus]PTE06068.1 hypothetical protein C6364_01755 [Lactobacillus delbrueckii]